MKRLFLYLFEFYIQASIHVALAVVSLLYVFTLSLEVTSDINLVLTLFFGTITGYNFVKYASVARLYHRSLTHSLRIIQMFSLASFFLMCFFGIKLPIDTLIVYGLVGFITVLYAVPLVASKSIRSIAGLKIYVVAICWVIAVVITPAVHYQLQFDDIILLKTIQIASLIIALIIPFDIRDLKYDNKQLRTIPQRFGVKKAKLIAFVLIILFVFMEFFANSWLGVLILLPMTVVTVLLILKTARAVPKYYCSFWIEGIPVIYLISLIITF